MNWPVVQYITVNRLMGIRTAVAITPTFLILGTGCPPDGSLDGRTFVSVADPSSEVLAYVQNTSGEILAAIGSKDAEGGASRVTAAYFQDAQGISWTVFIGADGLPAYAVREGWVFAFTNYASSTVDLTITSPNGTTGQYPSIGLNSDHIAILTSAASRLALVDPTSGKLDQAAKIQLSTVFNWVGAAVSVASCVGVAAGTIAASAGTFGAAIVPGAAATAVVCFGAGVNIGNLLWATDDSQNLGTVLSVATCVACPGTIINIAGRAAEAAERAAEEYSLDSDGDGVFDYRDNCPSVFNPTPQTDTDGDGIGDVCDPTPFGDPPTNGGGGVTEDCNPDYCVQQLFPKNVSGCEADALERNDHIAFGGWVTTPVSHQPCAMPLSGRGGSWPVFR